jgi:hypothetical protein
VLGRCDIEDATSGGGMLVALKTGPSIARACPVRSLVPHSW